MELLEDWGERDDLSSLGRLTVMTVSAQLGSERARERLEEVVFGIDDMDGPEWTEDDRQGHTLSHALREVRRRKPVLPTALIEKIVASARYNVATNGISALEAIGDIDALQRLIALYEAKSNWMLRDTISNSIELIAARQGVVILKVDGRYRVGS